ncbi:MAG: flagellar basal body rod protein FlgC [Rhodobacteraceae bacterium]|nr:flagellar basal body rod protein FlgC [Paracoccaceae bacterium]
MASSFETASSVSASAMAAQAERLRLVSENIANADTPGYRRKTTAFERVLGASDSARIEAGPVRLSNTALERIHDPGHPLANADGYYDGSNVNLITEIADAREAQRSYDANLRLFDQARQMTQRLLDIIRR